MKSTNARNVEVALTNSYAAIDRPTHERKRRYRFTGSVAGGLHQRLVSHHNMNTLVKITKDDDGTITENESWHLVDPCNEQGRAALCTQEFFGFGESQCEFKTKTSLKGGITCPKCLEIIRTYKRVRL